MKKIISIILGLVLVFAFVKTASAATPDDLVGWWKLDETSGTTVFDSTALVNDGTNNGAQNSQSGEIGTSYLFDGVNDYISNPIKVDKDFTTEITLEAWINPNSRQNGGIISNDITYSSKEGYDFFLWTAGGSHGRLYIDFGDGSTLGRIWWDIPSGWYGQWHHVAATYDGSAIKLYSDGQLRAETPYSGSYSSPIKHTLVGAINYSSPAYYYFNGLIDDVRIWKTALTAQDLGYLNNDSDLDGVLNGDDECENTSLTDEEWNEDWGTNRWQVMNGNNLEDTRFGWYQNKPAKKGEKIATYGYDMMHTYGCNGHQILNMLTEGLNENAMNGHYKFGLSSSVLEEFHTDLNDGVLDGRYYLDTIEVPANRSVDTVLGYSLMFGKDYLLKARGTAMACDQPGCVINFDAEYSTSDSTTWVDGVAAPYNIHGPNLLDLKVDSAFVDWGTYDTSHEYEIPYVGKGSPISLFINDLAGSHFNNSGSLFVDIYAEL